MSPTGWTFLVIHFICLISGYIYLPDQMFYNHPMMITFYNSLLKKRVWLCTFFKCPKGTECQEWPHYDHWMLGINGSVQQTWALKTYVIKDKCLFTVLPPLPMTLPAANDGTFMWASNLTSSFGPKKFSSFNFPKIRPWAWEKQQRESMN